MSYMHFFSIFQAADSTPDVHHKTTNQREAAKKGEPIKTAVFSAVKRTNGKTDKQSEKASSCQYTETQTRHY